MLFEHIGSFLQPLQENFGVVDILNTTGSFLQPLQDHPWTACYFVLSRVGRVRF